MSKVPVDDNMNEVIRKSAQESSDGTKYDLRNFIVNTELTLKTQSEQFDKITNILGNILCEQKATNEYLAIIVGEEIE